MDSSFESLGFKVGSKLIRRPYLKFTLAGVIWIAAATVAALQVAAQPTRPTSFRFDGASGYTQLTVSLAGTGSGTVASNVSGINCPTVCSASYNAGASITLTASAASGSTFAGWSGACSGSGSCVVSTNSNQSVTASFNTASSTTVFSITNQQPITKVFYPNTIWTTPLPADAGNHCLTNVTCSSSDPGTAIVNHIFNNSDTLDYRSFSLTCLNPGDCTTSQGNAFYYASQSDPVFRVNSNSAPCGAPGGPNYTSANCAAGKYFHMPSGATWDAVGQTTGCGDQGLTVWDQSSDIDPTPGGRIVGSYFCGTGVRSLPTNCTATTPAQADAQPQCQLSWYYNAVNFPFSDPNAWGDGGYASDGSATNAKWVREAEITGGAINHALTLGTACLRSSSGNGTADATVFPASGNAIGCSFVDSLRPLNGNLFWIDKSYDCSTLPLWQKPVCVAMQTYGGYMDATNGGGGSATAPSGMSLTVQGVEGGMAHQTAGVNDGFFNNWIIANGTGVTCPAGGYPKFCKDPGIGGQYSLGIQEDSASSSEKVIMFFFQAPGLITGHHLHILDPCVAIGLAGRSSYGGTNACK